MVDILHGGRDYESALTLDDWPQAAPVADRGMVRPRSRLSKSWKPGSAANLRRFTPERTFPSRSRRPLRASCGIART